MSETNRKRGMKDYVDLSGQRFGRWTVIKRVEDNHWKQIMYLCRCDCGWQGKIQARTLRSGDSKSCGCLRAEANRKRGKKAFANGTAFGGKRFYWKEVNNG
jgi:hypothetical protein